MIKWDINSTRIRKSEDPWWNGEEGLTTPAAPAVIAIGAVTALKPEEHITGIVTAREIEYAAANVGAACKYTVWAIYMYYWWWKWWFLPFQSFILFHCKFNMIVSTFSIKPRTPGFEGVEHFPPSVWITSTPSRCRSSASLPCSSSTSQETIAFEYKRIGLKMLFSECILSEDFSQIKIF